MNEAITKFVSLLNPRRFFILTVGILILNFGAFAGYLSSWNTIFLIFLDAILGLTIGFYYRSYSAFLVELFFAATVSSSVIHFSFHILPTDLTNNYFARTYWWPDILLVTFVSVGIPALLVITVRWVIMRFRSRHKSKSGNSEHV